jgi:hypothetical protein
MNIRSLLVVVGFGALTSGCLLVAAGAVEADRQNHKAAPPPPAPAATPDAGAAPQPAVPANNGTTNL